MSLQPSSNEYMNQTLQASFHHVFYIYVPLFDWCSIYTPGHGWKHATSCFSIADFVKVVL